MAMLNNQRVIGFDSGFHMVQSPHPPFRHATAPCVKTSGCNVAGTNWRKPCHARYQLLPGSIFRPKEPRLVKKEVVHGSHCLPSGNLTYTHTPKSLQCLRLTAIPNQNARHDPCPGTDLAKPLSQLETLALTSLDQTIMVLLCSIRFWSNSKTATYPKHKLNAASPRLPQKPSPKLISRFLGFRHDLGSWE